MSIIYLGTLYIKGIEHFYNLHSTSISEFRKKLVSHRRWPNMKDSGSLNVQLNTMLFNCVETNNSPGENLLWGVEQLYKKN